MIRLAASPHIQQSEDGETFLVLGSQNQFENVFHDIFNKMQAQHLREEAERWRGQQEWKWLFER